MYTEYDKTQAKQRKDVKGRGHYPVQYLNYSREGHVFSYFTI